MSAPRTLTPEEWDVVEGAIAHVLRRAVDDPAVGRHFGAITESTKRLIAAYAVLSGRNDDDVRAEWLAARASR